MSVCDFLFISLTAIPLITVVAAIRFFAVYKLPKKTFYVLWSIVLCKLFIPLNLLSRLNVGGYINGFIGSIKDMFVKAPEMADVASNTTNAQFAVTSPSVFPNISDMLGTITAPFTNTASTANPYVLPLILIWLAGLSVCAGYFIVSHIKFRRKYAESMPVDNEFIRNWKVEKSGFMRRKVQIKQSDLIISPLTYGIFHPVILLPKTTDYSDETKLKYILFHEYTHIRRLDTLAKLILTVVLCIHWFNPFVWFMYILANRDIELSCDETVVKTIRAGENANIKSDYALALISLEEKKTMINLLTNNFSKNIMKERITAIMKIKKISKARIMLTVVLIFAVTLIFATSSISAVNDTANIGNTQNIITTNSTFAENIKKILTLASSTTESPAAATQETAQDAYSNVKFGDDRNTLLLDVEWYTADEYSQEVVEPYKKYLDEYKKSDEYAKLSEDEKNQLETKLYQLKMTQNRISKKINYLAKTINGKSVGLFTVSYGTDNKGFDIFQLCNPDGYYIFRVYPYFPYVGYRDENGTIRYKSFGLDKRNSYVKSLSEYSYVLKNQIIPYCDDLLARGLITQNQYNSYTIPDPLAYYVSLYFS